MARWQNQKGFSQVVLIAVVAILTVVGIGIFFLKKPVLTDRSTNKSSSLHFDNLIDGANLQRTGTYNVTGVERPQGILWQFQIAAGGRYPPEIKYAPVYNSSIVFFCGTSLGNVKPNSSVIETKEDCYSLDKKTGAKNWEITLPFSISSSPVITEDTAYVVDIDGTMYALALEDGKKRWKFKTKDISQYTNEYVSSTIFGEEPSAHFGHIHTAPAIFQNTIYFNGYDNYFYAVNTKDAMVKWKKQLGESTHDLGKRSSPAILNNVIYFGDIKKLNGVDFMSGDEKWLFQMEKAIDSFFPVIDKESNSIYFVTGSYPEWTLQSVDISTNKTRWQKTLRGFSNPALLDDILYYISIDRSPLDKPLSDVHVGKLYAVDTNTGTELWNLDIESRLFDNWNSYADPTVANKLLYYAAYRTPNEQQSHITEEYVAAVDLMTKQEKWRYKVESGRVTTSIIPDNGVVYFGTDTGYLYALH